MWRIEAQGRQTATARENRQRRQSTSRDYSQPNPLGLFFVFSNAGYGSAVSLFTGKNGHTVAIATR